MFLKNRYYHLFIYAMTFLVIVACNTKGQNNQSSTSADFIPIFNGKTLEGWKGDTTIWSVEEGVLTGQTTPKTKLKQNTFLIWEGGTLADFELRAEFRITENGNSGINYRSTEVADIPFALKGYQADIDGRNTYTGQNYEERGRGIIAFRGQKVELPKVNGPLAEHLKNNVWTIAKLLATFGSSDSLKSVIKLNEWNNIRIVAKGNHLQHYINDVLMSEVIDNDTLNRKLYGLLGLQVHVGHPMKVEYKNLLLKVTASIELGNVKGMAKCSNLKRADLKN